MSKNLKHMTSIHEAANELHKLLVGTPGYIRIQVMSSPEGRSAVTTKKDNQAIVVYVRSADYISEPSVFNSWPVRYELGN